MVEGLSFLLNFPKTEEPWKLSTVHLARFEYQLDQSPSALAPRILQMHFLPSTFTKSFLNYTLNLISQARILISSESEHAWDLFFIPA